MQTLEPYLQHLETLTAELGLIECFDSKRHAVESALNGELSKTLRKVVKPEILQQYGAFFTGEAMADALLADVNSHEIPHVGVYDAACGGGNLLLAYARRLKVKSTLRSTIAYWGNILKGTDIHEELARATKARLVLLAAIRGMDEYGREFLRDGIANIQETFPFVTHGNSLLTEWPGAALIILNPPFNLAPVNEACRWATGRASQAALFMEKCLQEAIPGTIIKAILPDVLRSGSRYRRWRMLVETYADIKHLEVLGQFDSQTNVEVFALTMVAKRHPNRTDFNWLPISDVLDAVTIGDRCTVQVGRVVPHRDAQEGPEYPYFDVNNLPKWESIEPSQSRRRFMGNTFLPPFILIRRNSRATDAFRATATLIKPNPANPDEQVAVENHIIVVKPMSGKLSDSEQLLSVFKDARTNNWLNQHIRCRHLTVSAIQSIPWWN